MIDCESLKIKKLKPMGLRIKEILYRKKMLSQFSLSEDCCTYICVEPKIIRVYN